MLYVPKSSSLEKPMFAELSDLSERKNQNLFWSHPENLILNRQGVTVRIKDKQVARSIEITADHNDTYHVSIVRNGTSLWNADAGPSQGGSALSVYTLPFKSKMTLQPKDEIRIIPQGGDGRLVWGI